MSLKNKIKQSGRKIYDSISDGILLTLFSGMLLGTCGPIVENLTYPIRELAAIPAYGYYMAAEAGIEALQNSKKTNYEGALIDKGELSMLQTHAKLYYADFKLLNGKIVRTYDTPKILENKLLFNEVVPNLEIGKRYNVNTIGNCLLNARTLQN